MEIVEVKEWLIRWLAGKASFCVQMILFNLFMHTLSWLNLIILIVFCFNSLNNAKLSVPLWLLRRLNENADQSIFFLTAQCRAARCFLVSERLCFLLPSKIFSALRKELPVLVLK
ncbi:hypothetical protein T4B_3818 [Trichinella pseudospiralis]|uniref:Uncharacterized protein n=3 Tax=Trichinella pseudospiralis TaxID=6337 RepID=A0A0V1FAC9_TRIPS|nr:hypothetical protein T4D_15170 [Trichinella pseudospiralis]KRZ20765.1 hypothetical protein T4B_3818 [Trichinella pseudospiralis]